MGSKIQKIDIHIYKLRYKITMKSVYVNTVLRDGHVLVWVVEQRVPFADSYVALENETNGQSWLVGMGAEDSRLFLSLNAMIGSTSQPNPLVSKTSSTAAK